MFIQLSYQKNLVLLNLLYTIKYVVFKLGVSKMSNQRTIKWPTYSVLNFNKKSELYKIIN